MKTLFVHNSSKHCSAAVRWLANYAYRYVHKESLREGWYDEFAQLPIALRVTHTSHAYRGRFLGTHRAGRIHRFPFQQLGLGMDTRVRNVLVRNVLVRVGNPKHFPVDATYPRFKNMPPARINDWVEAVVGLCTHELAHIKYSGRRQGEVNCELTEIDCVNQFRKDRQEFEDYMAKVKQKDGERELALAAKQAPDVVLSQKLKKLQRRLETWQRKSKLAANKVKRYTREIKRLERKASKLQEAQ